MLIFNGCIIFSSWLCLSCFFDLGRRMLMWQFAKLELPFLDTSCGPAIGLLNMAPVESSLPKKRLDGEFPVRKVLACQRRSTFSILTGSIFTIPSHEWFMIGFPTLPHEQCAKPCLVYDNGIRLPGIVRIQERGEFRTKANQYFMVHDIMIYWGFSFFRGCPFIARWMAFSFTANPVNRWRRIGGTSMT